MKKIFTVLAAVILMASVWAQSPQKMSYQAVIRDAGNTLVTSHAVGMRINILQGSSGGSSVYTETQATTTNINGLVSIEIGTGTIVYGSLAAINWSNGTYFIKTETDPAGGTNYTAIVGTSPLLSVPYALHATTADNGFSGNYNDLTNKPILFDGNYNSLSNLPTLFDGTWTSLTGKPTLATVATSGSYDDLSNKPTINNSQWTTSGSGIYYNTGKVSIGTINSTFPLEVSVPSTNGSQFNLKLTNLTLGIGSGVGILFAPDDAAIAKMGIFVERRGPWGLSTMHFLSRTSPDYTSADLSNSVMSITSNGYVGMGTTTPAVRLDVIGVINATGGNSTNWNTAFGWGNHAGLYHPIAWVPAWTDVTGKPTFATVATSGSYADLSNIPTTDGSETKVFAGTNVIVTGTGTTGSPYVVNAPVASITTYSVCQVALGGIIVATWDGGIHGLVVATTEESTSSTWYNANYISDRKTTGNYYNWRLPNIGELFIMNSKNSSCALGLVSSGPVYWSSTQFDAGLAWYFSPAYSVDGPADMANAYYVRAVRSF